MHESEAEHSSGGARVVDADLRQVSATSLLEIKSSEFFAVEIADLSDPAGLSQNHVFWTDRVFVGHAPACLSNSLIGASVIKTFRSMAGSLRSPVPPTAWLRFPVIRLPVHVSTRVDSWTYISTKDIREQHSQAIIPQ